MNKLRVAVLMGGPSKEHEVSLSSGAAMAENLNNDLYEITPIIISKENIWRFEDGSKLTLIPALEKLKKDTDVVMLALHGTFGEDGTIQALLAQRGITFTGSNAAASLLAMDKVTCGLMYAGNGLITPTTVVIEPEQAAQSVNLVSDKLSVPVVVKPSRQGSSVGVSIVKSDLDILPAVELALRYDQTALIQEYINGREVSCGVLEKPELVALPPTELIPQKNDFFDYASKYEIGGAKEITPPDMPADIIKEIQSIAIKAHKLLGCSGYSRTDMIVTGSQIYTIETNTLPGMTNTSILPQQAAAAGISFSDMLDAIIEAATK